MRILSGRIFWRFQVLWLLGRVAGIANGSNLRSQASKPKNLAFNVEHRYNIATQHHSGPLAIYIQLEHPLPPSYSKAQSQHHLCEEHQGECHIKEVEHTLCAWLFTAPGTLSALFSWIRRAVSQGLEVKPLEKNHKQICWGRTMNS